ncbi:MAG: sigma-70 family RNA polymerase sigma factor [Ruminococcaceae bacterium]|nr:sigma-70 family RNA polymerase sigma factor [Oscillospiraceae bacterium]
MKVLSKEFKTMEHELAKYTDPLYYAALRLTGNADTAADLAQETFLAAWQSLSRGYRPDNLWAWLNRILSNKHCDLLREKYRRPTIRWDDWVMDEAFREPFEEAGTEDETDGQLEAIRREIGYLARTHREVFIRFYLHGETIETIAAAMGIPAGTVKSRLNKGRQQVRKGVETMETYAKQSYEPEILRISCSGGAGLDGEPFSLVGYDDALTQNILIVAYEKPLTEVEIAKVLGTPAAFIEPIVKRLVDGELMARTDGGKVYSDFIQFTREDHYANFREQLRYADEHYADIRDDLRAALDTLRGTDYYQRQDESCRRKLELHYAISVMLCAVLDIAGTVHKVISYDEYPYRKNGGRWLAMGNHYPAGYDWSMDEEYWRYGMDGEFGEDVLDLYDTKRIWFRGFSTKLGQIPYDHTRKEHIKWMYELHSGIHSGTIEAGVLESADVLIEHGLLKKDSAVSLNIPVLTEEEYYSEKALANQMGRPIVDRLGGSMADMIRRTRVKLPPHLTGVPEWQQYFLSRESLTMAFLFHAIEDGLLLAEEKEPVPAVLLVITKK